MLKKIFYKKQYFFLIISFFLSVSLLGTDYFDPRNSSWLVNGDLSTYQIGWDFFRSDVWRFPLFSNPNYGIYLQSSIVFSDSIPLFAFFFKLLNYFLPNNFQYFSLWILLCFYLQGLISYLILFKITRSANYSLMGSVFFLFSTILIHRSAINLSLFGHWIILLFFYLELTIDKKKFLFQVLTILLSIFIHFYFTLILLIVYFITKALDFFYRKISLRTFLFEKSILIILVLATMYILGYFSISADDGLGWGYGFYNLNLNGFFNPTGITFEKINWSNFISTKEIKNGEMEGFSYLGISGIIFLFLYIKFFIFKSDHVIIFNSQKIFILTFIFLILSISNNINFNDQNLIIIPLNKYLYASLSLFRASGRLVWPVYYLIFIVGLVSIYQLFPKKNLYVIVLLVFIQIADISSGLKNYLHGKQYQISKPMTLEERILWSDISKKFSFLRLLEPKNQSEIYYQLVPVLLNYDFKGTDIIYHARVNRELIVKEKYKLVENIISKNLEFFDDTLFISNNKSYINYLLENFSKNLFIYKYKNLWLISKIQLNTTLDTLIDIKPNIFEINLDKKNNLPLDDPGIFKMGFIKHDTEKKLYLDGENGVLNFKIKGKKCKDNINMKVVINSVYKEIFLNSDFEIFMNNKKINFNIFDNVINFKFRCDESLKQEFRIISKKNLSEYDKRKGLNRHKKSIIIDTISFY